MMPPANPGDWRRQRRTELLALRAAVDSETRSSWGRSISRSLLQALPLLRGRNLAIYWPIQGEYDPRFVARELRAAGSRIALPAVAGKAKPLIFREWRPGVEMRPGGLGIPYPVATRELVPDACLVPPVGFDAKGYRLGYGAGFFDRTLAALSPRPLAIGVAFECARIDTIYPQEHDIALDFMITEAGVFHTRASGLERVDPADVNGLALDLISARKRAQAALGSPDAERYSSPVCYARDIAPGYFGEEPEPK